MLGSDFNLDCAQSGFGITPIIGLDWNLGTACVFTDELSRITGLPKEAIIVLFHELPYEDVASGGVLLSDRH